MLKNTNAMIKTPTKKLLISILGILIFSQINLHAEGIKELANGTTNYPITEFGHNGWADPGAPDNLKLFIYIEDPTIESIYFGFSSTEEEYKVYNPNGVLVYTDTTNGNASVVAEAIAGPADVVGPSGYTAQVFTLPPGSPAGNYYIEFDGSSNEQYWDISVAKSGNSYTEIGRVWSMIWNFDMAGWNAANSFEATLYAYSTEGFVSKVDYKNSNFRPYVFSVYYNATGPGSSGNLEEDRKSVNGANAGTASFPVFLNPPPEEIMPSAEFGDLVGTPTITRTAATGPNKFSFNLSSTQPGTFRILLNVENPSTPDKYDTVQNTKDRVIVFDVIPEPGEVPPYYRAMPWDGLDGDGTELADGFLLNFTVGYADGRSHFPTYDAEYLADGLTVDQVRPSNAYDIQLFWDDSNIKDGSGIPDDPNNSSHGDFPDGTTGYSVELNGAEPPSHTWVNNNYGNNNTINTWWYCSLKQNVDQTIPLPGIAGSAPTIQATNIAFSEIGNTAMKVSWTNGNGVRRAAFISETTSGQPFPVDNTSYTPGTVFGAGDQIGTSGWYCIYDGADSPQTVVTGLTEDTDYRVMVCEYNNGGGIEYYNTSLATDNPADTSTIIIDQATNVSFTNVLANSFTVNWTNGTGTRRAAFIKLTSVAGDAAPENNVTYYPSSVYGVGDLIASSQWYCIYDGTDSTVNVSNLAKNTDYTVMVCEYFGSAGNENYVTVTNATDPNNQVTLAESPAHHIVFNKITTDSMDIAWTNGDGTNRQVFIKQTSDPSDQPLPVDGTSYTPNTIFGSGEQIGTTGWYCIYDGIAPAVSISGLSPSTDYKIMVCDYTGSHDYIEGSVSTNPLIQATFGTTPTVQAHDITFPNTGASQMEINWVNGNGTKRILFAAQTTTGQPAPVDGTNYNANAGFELGSQIGTTGWYCIYNGTDTSVTMSNILEDTDYRFMVCEYNQDITGPLYNTSTAVLNPQNNKSLTAGITVSAISQNTTEAGQTATFTIVLNTQPTADVTIGLTSNDLTEGTISHTDVTFTSGDWNIPQTITVTGQNDAIFDGDISYSIVTAAASSTDANYNGINADDVAVVNDDDDSPTADLSVTTNGDENGPVAMVYTVTLSTTNNTGSDITFEFDDATTGSATSGTDYTAIPGAAQITVADGATTGTISVPVLDDADFEGTETIGATISSPSNVDVTISTASATGNISDDETVNADLSVTTNGDEDGPVNIVYTVTLSGTNNTGAGITFEFDDAATGTATSGTDYTAIAGAAQITVADGATTGTISVPVINDTDLEATETVIAGINTPSETGVTITTASATANISDNETATAALSVTTDGDENGPVTMIYTVTLSTTNNTGSDITFEFDDATTGSATSGTDYTAIPGAAQITVADGASTGTISVPVLDDANFEGVETIDAVISSPSNADVTISTASATGNIADNETVDADLSVTTDGDEDGPVNIVYTVTLSGTNNTGSGITFEFDDATTGTATSGTDYTAIAGSAQITVANGATTGTISVPVINDTDLETTETVIAGINTPSVSGVTITTASATANITDDETATADLSVTTNGDENGPVAMVYTVTLSTANNTGSDITFEFDDATTGSATSGTDYTAIPGAAQITVANGATTGTISVPVINDTDLETTETVIAGINTPSVSGVTITTASATANITDDETATADLSVTTNGDENGPVAMVYTVTLSTTNKTGSDITFEFDDATTGSATSGTDYTAIPGAAQITVADGASTGTISVPVLDDADFEGTETIGATISSPSNTDVTISTATATGNIADNETVDADLSVTTDGDEDGPVNIVYTVTLSGTNNTGSGITFEFDDATTGSATSGTDYTAIAGPAQITVANGATTGTISVPVINDTDLETTETVIAGINTPSVSGVTITTASATANITDDETATADLSVTTHGDENGPVAMVYTVTLSTANNTGSDITFEFDDATTGSATSGTDYTAIPGAAQITVADGASTGTISIPVLDDADFEGTETIGATISSPSNTDVTISTASATGNIIDDEAINAALSVTTHGDEDGSVAIEYTLTLSSANSTGSTITFDFADAGTGTATSGNDYTAIPGGTQLSIANGASSASYSVSVSDDALLEITETVIATISNPSNGGVSIITASATANITDNETATADLSVTTNGDENGPVAMVYTVTLSAANNTGSDITFEFDDATSGTATSGTDYNAIAGAAQITVADGATTGTISVPIIDDAHFEGTETIGATISSPSNTDVTISTATATGNIVDDEANNATLSVTTHGDENGPVNIVYTVTLSETNNTGFDITFEFDDAATGSAISGTDYTAIASAAQITVADGASTGTISISVIDDSNFEGTETIDASISSPSNTDISIAIASSVANIYDDELPPPNQSPIAQNDDVTINSGGTAEGNLLSNDSDPDGDNLSINTDPVSGPSNGVLTINSDGTFSYQSNNGFVGTDSFVYQVCDNGSPSECSNATVTITVTSNDLDNDGIPNDVEGTDDPDNDGIPSNEDTDSDGDGIPDEDEGNKDTDGDGTPDYKDLDSDDDGIPDSDEGNIDTDGDGTPDYNDLDSDDDGILDEDEGDIDTDGDGSDDYRDLDSDNDGILDSDEGDIDTDGDGSENYRDTDSDNDGILDGDEEAGDCDEDGIPNGIDPDPCNQGAEEIFIPEGFSPNNDRDNDYFVIPEIDQYVHVSIKIFNRWGNVIYKQDNYENNWDGSSNVNLSIGEELPSGTYFYQLDIHDTGDHLTGYVYLNR